MAHQIAKWQQQAPLLPTGLDIKEKLLTGDVIVLMFLSQLVDQRV